MAKKKENFVEKIKLLHGDKYDYSKIVYVNKRTKVLIGYKGCFILTKPEMLEKPNYKHNSTIFRNDDFIEKSIRIHGNKYDYSRVEYTTNTGIILIGFNGKFYKTTPQVHLKGCKIENGWNTYTQEEFIDLCLGMHHKFYGYHKTEFRVLSDKITIYCPKHDYYFNQMANDHLNGHGCPKCGKESMVEKTRLSSIEIKKKIFEKHGVNYSYLNLDDNITMNTELELICSTHGSFKQSVKNHLLHGCQKCGYVKSGILTRSNKETFTNKAIQVHNNLYTYDNFIYTLSNKPSNITCKIHGDFLQAPNHHLGGRGCVECGYELVSITKKISQKEYLSRCIEKHGKLYDYSITIYSTARENVNIICDKHGIFEQNAQFHMYGGNCPKCNLSKGELIIRSFLESINIIFDEQKKFPDCKYKSHLPFDFYLPYENILIEYDGEQHYKSMEFFGGESAFNQLKLRDSIKNEYCIESNIKLIRIPYWEIDNINEILSEELKQYVSIE